mmetsp:Transcript_8317/g.9465  ORF Transcript_8317/g.9465 Transcript_8317/m.9465 type:complete len:93 (+) Transcript_8317:627-905(+)
MVLRDDSDAAAQRLLRELEHVIPTDRHPPFIDLIETKQQPSYSALARPRLTHDRCGCSSRNDEADILQYYYFLPRWVREGDIAELDLEWCVQ